MNAMLQLRDVHKSFGRNEVLKGVDLSVDAGEVVVILGASGSGKTTLLRTINFLERADSGTMSLAGRGFDLHRAGKKDVLWARRRTAFVFQQHNLFNNRTALGNVTEGLIHGHGKTKSEAETLAREALDWVGLAHKADAYPSQLSGGQQQRVGIARAIALEPEVILFDEPTSALDPELVGETLAIMRRVARRGITMVVVTHEMSFAAEVASNVVFMDGGVIVEQGPPTEMFRNPRHERTRKFLGRLLQRGADDYVI